MPSFIFEHYKSGVFLGVDYTPGEPPTINDIRVLDIAYRPVGPDLTDLLLDMAFIKLREEDSVLTATPCLARIAEDIQ